MNAISTGRRASIRFARPSWTTAGALTNTIDTMRISRELLEKIVAHAREEAPNECCGMVACADGSAVEVYPTSNAEASPFRFMIDPREQLRVHNEIETRGLELGAIYHSHTRTEPRPSQTDVIFSRGWPGVVWIIVGLSNGEPEVRAFTIQDASVSEVKLIVE